MGWGPISYGSPDNSFLAKLRVDETPAPGAPESLNKRRCVLNIKPYL